MRALAWPKAVERPKRSMMRLASATSRRKVWSGSTTALLQEKSAADERRLNNLRTLDAKQEESRKALLHCSTRCFLCAFAALRQRSAVRFFVRHCSPDAQRLERGETGRSIPHPFPLSRAERGKG